MWDGIVEDNFGGRESTSGAAIKIAAMQTRTAAIRKGIARKYLAGIVKIRASGNIRTPTALNEQIVRAQVSPRRSELAQK